MCKGTTSERRTSMNGKAFAEVDCKTKNQQKYNNNVNVTYLSLNRADCENRVVVNGSRERTLNTRSCVNLKWMRWKNFESLINSDINP
jgi:hypothetical protein